MAKKTDPNSHESKRPDERQIMPAAGNGNAEALARREAIADSADATRTGDLTPIGEDQEVVVAPPASEEITETQPVTEPTEVVEPVRKFKVPVNGKTLELTEDELIARAAKVESADEYLKAASESVKTAATVNLSQQDEKPLDLKALARAIQMGTEEEAEQALLQLTKTLQPSKTPDVEEVVERRLSFREALQKAREEQAELINHPVLGEVFNSRLTLYASNHPTETIQQGYKAVADGVRKDFEMMLKTPVSKAERKAQVAPVPTAAGRQVTVSDDEGEDSPEVTIAAMAKARGQDRPTSH